MNQTSVANEKTNPFYVRLKSTPGETWYIIDLSEEAFLDAERQTLTLDQKARDFLIDRVGFFNNKIWYHFTVDNLTGWLPKSSVRNNFLRLAIQPIKQETQSDIDNWCAAMMMLLKSAGSQITTSELKNRVINWEKNSNRLIDLRELVISETHSIRDLRRVNFRQLNRQLLRRKPIVARVHGIDNLKVSFILIIGFKRKTYFYNDPWTGRIESISHQQLKKHCGFGVLEAMSY